MLYTIWVLFYILNTQGIWGKYFLGGNGSNVNGFLMSLIMIVILKTPDEIYILYITEAMKSVIVSSHVSNGTNILLQLYYQIF